MPQTETSDITSFERIALDELESPVVRQGVAYWNFLRGDRRYPPRAEVHPRDFVSLLKYVLLIRVIDRGADFEFRIVGDAQAQTYVVRFAGKRLGEMRATCPPYGYVLHGLFGHVTQFGEAVALRGHFGSDFANVNIAYCETAFMPLGTGETVDHLLGFTAFVGNAA